MKHALSLLTALFVAVFTLLTISPLRAQIITTYAGSASYGYSGDGGAATAAELNFPYNLAIDGSGNIYVADANNNRIRKINSSGIISTFAGNGTPGYAGDGGAATAAKLSEPLGVAVDSSGNVYISDYGNSRIRKVATSGIISTYAGNGTAGYGGDGGAATAAELYYPHGIALDGSGNLYIGDVENNRVRKVSVSGIISTIAGNGSTGYSGDGGAATSAEIDGPIGVAVDGSGNVYIADAYNNRVRKVTTSGVISTFAGDGTAGSAGDGGAATAAELNDPYGVAVDGSGNVYIAEYENNKIRKVTTAGIISTVAGDGTSGYSGDGGAATAAELFWPTGVLVDGSGTIYIADYENSRVRKVSAATTTCAGTPTAGTPTSTLTTTCPSTSFNLNLSGATSGAGISYQWQSSTTGASWTNITGATTLPYTTTESEATYYQCIVSCSASGLSAASTAILIGYSSACYCIPDYDSSFLTEACSSYHMDIAAFHLYGAESTYILDNNACNGTGYEIYSATSADLQPGATYTPTIYTGASYEMHVQVWIDFNNNGTFETSESVGGANDYVDSEAFTITIPSSVPRTTTRMRVVTVYSSPSYPDINPCPSSSYSYGETRDYTVNIGAVDLVVAAPDTLNFGCEFTSTTTVRAASLSGLYLSPASGSLTVTAPANFQVSSSSSGSWVTSYTISYSGGTVSPNTIYVAFNPSAASSYSGNVTITGAGLSTPMDIYVYGSGCGTECSGTPAAGTVVSATGAWCEAILYIEGASTGNLISYQWQTSTDSSHWTNITGATLNLYTGSVSSDTYYRCVVTCSASSTSAYSAGLLLTPTGAPTVAAISGPTTVSTGSTITLSDGTSGGSWSSSSTSIATVSSGGVVTGVAAGSVTISYSVTNSCGTTAVTYGVTVGSSSGTSCNIITTIAGDGTAGFSGDGGAATTAEIDIPYGIAVDRNNGNVYISDAVNNRIRKVTAGGIISTFAGSGTGGYSGDGGAATAAELNSPYGVAVDGSSNVYIADYLNRRIRKVSSSGIISTMAGDGTSGYSGDGGAATAAEFAWPVGVAVDGSGNVYIADPSTARIRKVTLAGIVTTIAGNGTSGYSGDGGAATAAELSNMWGVAVDTGGNLYIADLGNNRIRKVNSAGIITTFAGNGTVGSTGDGGAATAAELSNPYTVAVDESGNVYIPDWGNNKIRQVNLSGIINTVVGDGTSGYSGDGGAPTAAELDNPYGVAFDTSGNMYISDHYNSRIRKIAPGAPTVSTISGPTTVSTGSTITLSDATSGGTWSSSNTSIATVSSGGVVTGVAAGSVTISYSVTNSCGTTAVTYGVAVSGGTLSAYISADSLNFGVDSVCKTTAPQVLKLAATYLSPDSGSLTVYAPTDFEVCSTVGGTYVTSYTIPYSSSTLDTTSIYIKFVAPCTPGNYSGCLSITGGGLSASFCVPVLASCAVACSGTPNGGTASISPVYGGATTPFTLSVSGYSASYGITFQWQVSATGTGGWSNISGATNATYSFTGVSGNYCYQCIVYCPYDGYSSTSVKTCVTYSGEPSPIITTFAGDGTGGYTGDGGAATAAEIDYLSGVAADGAGNVYITDYASNVIRKVNASGIISTFAGNGGGGYSGDGGAATAAKLDQPGGLAVDASGNVYIADFYNNRIRKVNTSGIISTYAGSGTSGFSGDGGAATGAELSGPSGVAIDHSGNLYITDNSNYRIRKVNTSGVISTFAGNGTSGFSGDGGAATAAKVEGFAGICTDPSGNVYFVDGTTYRVRKINTSGVISTICGNGAAGYSGDDGSATAAELNRPNGVCSDPSGNIYICDQYNNRIRQINTYGVITTYAGNGTMAFAGDGGPATAAEMSLPTGVCTNSAGNLFISDFTDYRVRRVGQGNHPPSFTGGASQSITVCANTTGNSINSYMAISDADSGQTETWTVTASPAHGSLTGFPYTATSDRGTITPTGLSYAPTTGYSGSDSFKVQVSDGMATATTVIYVTVTADPVAGTITGAATVCAGSTITLGDSTASSSSGAWSSSSTAIATVSAGVVRGVSAGSVTISYAVTNSCATAVAVKTITVSPAVTAGSISGASSVCTGATIILTDSISGGVWTSGSTAIATVSSGGSVRGVATGTVIITYTITSSCGEASATKSITVGTVPSVPAISGPTAVCSGATITLSDAATGGSWVSGATSVASVGSGTGIVTGVAAGSTTITYTVTNTCGSTAATTTVTVTSAPATPAAIGGSAAACTGATTTLTDATAGGVWSSASTGIASVSASGVVTGIAAGTATISYTVTNSCGAAAATLAVTVTASPSAGTITGASTLCAGATATYTDAASGGTWSTGSASVATINTSGVVGGVAAGADNITYTVTNSCGTATASLSITVNPLPVAGTVVGSAAVCPGETITLSDAATGGVWSSSNPAAATVAGGVVRGVAAGSATISYSVTNSCGIVAATKTVSVGSVASAGTISGPSNMCVGSSFTFTDTTAGGIWSSSSTAIASVSPSGVVTGYSTGTVAISYTITTACGSASAGIVVTVGSIPVAGTISGPTTVCTGTSIDLTDAATGGGWTSSNTAIATVASATGVVTGVSAGTVTISYYLSSSCATAITTATITVTESVTAAAISGLGAVCAGDSIVLTDASGGGAWSSSSTAKATVSSTGAVRGIAAGAVTISYSLSGSCGTAVATKAITINALPSVSAISGASAICTGSATTLSDATTGGSWISSNSAVASVSPSGVVTGAAVGSATITYIVTNGCGATTVTKPVTVSSLSAGLLSGAATVAAGSLITLTSSISGGTWASSNTALATVSATGAVTGVAVGADTITYSVTNACGTATARKTISVTAGRDELPTENPSTGGIKVYPNPNTGAFTLEIPGNPGAAAILVTDLTGRVLESLNSNEETVNIDLSGYADGAYLLQVNVKGKTHSEKLIKN